MEDSPKDKSQLYLIVILFSVLTILLVGIVSVIINITGGINTAKYQEVQDELAFESSQTSSELNYNFSIE